MKETIKLKILDTGEVKEFPIYQAANLMFNQTKRWRKVLYEQVEEFDFSQLPPPPTGDCVGCGGQSKKENELGQAETLPNNDKGRRGSKKDISE